MNFSLLFSQNGSWETIFSKSSENICENEFNCCRRIVQLCRDCLLIVYQFAAEAKSSSQQNSENSELSSAGYVSHFIVECLLVSLIAYFLDFYLCMYF